MKWSLCLVLATAGCQEAKQQQRISDPQGTAVISLPKAQVTDVYRADITALCDCVKLSGADQKPKDERWPVIAMWLGPNIKTSEGHEFLIAIQPLKGEAKALALETEAKRVGLPTCALAADWRGNGT
jgi:hypothetical protein